MDGLVGRAEQQDRQRQRQPLSLGQTFPLENLRSLALRANGWSGLVVTRPTLSCPYRRPFYHGIEPPHAIAYSLCTRALDRRYSYTRDCVKVMQP